MCCGVFSVVVCSYLCPSTTFDYLLPLLYCITNCWGKFNLARTVSNDLELKSNFIVITQRAV